MEKSDFVKEVEELKIKNKELQRQLNETKRALDLIKTGGLDALVTPDEKAPKIYTEVTADKTYRILIEKMHEGVLTLSRAGIILYCNTRFADMIHLPLQELIGTKIGDVIDDPSKVRFEDLIKQGWEKDVQDELYIYGKDGRETPLLVSVKNLAIDDNSILSIIFTDLTLQKRAQENLKIKNQVLEEAEKLAGIGSWVVDINTNKVTVSDELYKIYGLDPVKNLKQFSPFELIHQNDLPTSKMIIEAAIKDLGSFDTYSVINPPSQKKERKLHIKGKVLTEDGNANKLIGVTQDVTELINEKAVKIKG